MDESRKGSEKQILRSENIFMLCLCHATLVSEKEDKAS